MILNLLAASVVAAAPTPAPTGPATPAGDSATTVKPIVVEGSDRKGGPPPDATVLIPSDDTAGGGHWASVWPAGAYQAHISGHVILACDVDQYGLAERCDVASETPVGRGFGAAALELRPTFKLKPPVGSDGPPTTLMRIAVEFKAPETQVDFGRGRDGGPVGERAGVPGRPQEMTADMTDWRNPLVRRPVAMLNNPVWTKTVGYDDVLRAYPAKAAGVEGYAVAHCEVRSSGSLAQCQIIKEDPENLGFGKAAVKLASQFQVSSEWVKAPGHADVWTDIPIRFPGAGAAGNRTVASPYWVSGFDPDQTLKLFPPEAAAQGVTHGRGVAKCVVEKDGTLADCSPVDAESDGAGFSEVAVRLASTMRMNPWTVDGQPVDGAVVRLGVQLKLRAN